MIKVAHVSTALTGGAGIAAYRVHQGMLNRSDIASSFLQKKDIGIDINDVRNIENNVYTINPTYSLLYRFKKKLRLTDDDHYQKIIEKNPANYEIITTPVNPFRIEDCQEVRDADIVHLHWVANFLNYPSFFKSIKKPIVWTLHDMNPFMGVFHYEEDKLKNKGTLSDLDDWAIKNKMRYLRNSNLHIVSPSKWLLQKSQNSSLFNRYSHTLIPYGMDMNKYPLLDKESVKKELNLNNGKKNILFVAQGINNYRKGFDILYDALQKIKPDNINLIGIGHGDVNIGNDINYIKTGQISDISEMNKYYAAADLTVIASREDNLPNVMLESLANGTPVICFENGGMAEHVQTGDTGILIRETSGVALAQGIDDFLKDKYTFDREAIRNYANNIFADNIQFENYMNLYKSII